MNLTDVPQSGIYYQRAAIVQLIVQILDINTGLPVQLQTANGFSISILYPDLLTSQTFVAALYSDGSDGKITYITKNDGVTIDLNQVGLYQVQGDAVIGGVSLPPTYETDFYVLPNVFGGTMPAIVTPSAIVLYDSDNVRWVGTISAPNVLSWAAQIEGPAGFFQPNALVMKDSTGLYWTITISTLGVPVFTAIGGFPQAINYFELSDINGKSWLVTVSAVPDLVAS